MSLAGKDLNLLLALQALLEERNVTRAAERLNMGQSGMSAALRRLRVHYDDDLLIRVGRDYELSPTARLLLVQVRRTVPLIAQALGSPTDFNPRAANRSFSVAASDYAVVELHNHLGRRLHDFPGVSFASSPWGEEALDESLFLRYDFVVTIPGSGLISTSATLLVDHFVCVVDRQHPAAHTGALSWDAFASAPQITADFGPGIQAPYDHHLSGMDFVRRSRVSTRGFLPIPSIVAGTALVGIVPARLAARVCEANGTVALEPPFGEVQLVEMLSWHPSLDDDPGHVWARTLILESFAAERRRAPA